jgi:hypothetical protein
VRKSPKQSALNNIDKILKRKWSGEKMLSDKLINYLQASGPTIWESYQAILELQNDLYGEINHHLQIEITTAAASRQIEELKQLTVFLEEISEFLNDDGDTISKNERVGEKPVDYTVYQVSSEIQHSIDESFTYKRPSGFILQGQKYENINNWQELLLKVLEILYQKDPEKIRAAAKDDPTFQGRKSRMLGLVNTNMRNPRQLGELWLETNLSSNSIVRNIKKLLHVCAIPESTMKIFLRADYSSLHRKDETESSK